MKRRLQNLRLERTTPYLWMNMGWTNLALDKLIKASYELLDLITFFTAGKQEVRAWTVKKGSKAPQAAGSHSFRF